MQEKMLNFNAKTQNQQVKYQTNGGSDIQPAGKQPLRIEKIIAHSILSRQPFPRNMHNNLHYYDKWLQHAAFALCNYFFEIV